MLTVFCFSPELQAQCTPAGARSGILAADGRHRGRERRLADVETRAPRGGPYHCAVWPTDRRAASRADRRGADPGEGGAEADQG